jgi:hypothetical protein
LVAATSEKHVDDWCTPFQRQQGLFNSDSTCQTESPQKQVRATLSSGESIEMFYLTSEDNNSSCKSFPVEIVRDKMIMSSEFYYFGRNINPEKAWISS